MSELANIMYTIRDPSKDKPFELEMGWLCEATEWKYASVPAELLTAADSAAKALIADGGIGGGVGGDELLMDTA